MSPKKAIRKFMDALAHAPEGARLEVGLIWDEHKGWRVYQRLGHLGLFMGPADARLLAATFEKVGARPEWKSVKHGLEGTLGALRPLADEAEQKNRDKILPANAAAFMTAMGSA